MMQFETLQWPGLWDLPFCIVDYETNKVYDRDHPLPPQKSHLDSVKNRCVRLSAVLSLFSEEMRDEAEWRLRQLQCSYDIGSAIHSTTPASRLTSTSDSDEVTEPKVITYIPSIALMAFAIIWPYCQSFQKMQNAVLDHLDNYAESVCIDCGFIHRDCKCTSVDRRHCSSQQVLLGSAVSVKDSGMQTEPMVVFSMQQKVTAPGISVVVPQNYHLSPDVRMPLIPGQPSALTQPPLSAAGGINIGTLTPNIITLPPSVTFPTGYPPSFVNPLSLSTSIGSQSGVSLLRPPALLAAANAAQVLNSTTADAASRKRKLDTDAGGMADVSVQTTGKSHVKKMKLKMGPFTASEFKIIGKDGSVLCRNQQNSTNNQGAAKDDSETGTSEKTQTDEGEKVSTNATASPAGKSGLKKDAETPVEKKYTTVWKLLEDSSDDEASVGEPTSASQDVPVSTAVAENAASETANCDVTPSSTEAVSSTATQHATEETDSVADPQTQTQVKDENMVRDNGHQIEDDDEDKLVIDTHVDTEHQESQLKNKSAVLQQSNDWEFRNGMKETELGDDVEEVNKPAGGEEGAASEVKIENIDDDGFGKPSAVAIDVDKSLSADDNAVDASKLNPVATDSAVGDFTAPADQVTEQNRAENENSGIDPTLETTNTESSPKPRKVYGKFEYTPTGEHILRCLVPKCSQTFDRKLVADVHNHVHPGFMPGTEVSEGATYLQCHRCDFQAPFYHWYDLLRHMRQKHDISLTDSTAEHTCEYCGLGFETKDLLVSHIDFHYSNRYKCIYCGLLLLTWGQVQRHLETCAEKSKLVRTGGVNLGCPFCTFVFHKRNIRNLHLLSHVDKGLACALCDNDVIWADWKSLRKHYQQKHAKSMMEKISPFGHDLPHRQPPLRCTRAGCDVTFKTFALFSNHMCRAHDLVPYTLIRCVQCERCFRTEKSHEWHVRHMHGEERLCDKCDFVASSKAMLKLHVSQKHQEKQHVCTECDKSFLYFHQLRIHMAHHARRSIYPCRRCDLEFTRLAELRAHLRDEHQGDSAAAESEEKKSGHSCPECDFNAPTRSAVVQHVRRVHPELADGTTEAEDDDPDHSYFNSKLDLPPQPLTPPPLSPRRPLLPSQFARNLMSRRGRPRTVTAPATNYYSRADRYVTVVDRRERRNQLRIEKEAEDRVKHLRRETCARSRSIEEHRTMGQGEILSSRQSEVTDDGTEVTGIVDVGTSSPVLETYPYLDHCYFSTDPNRLQSQWKAAVGRPGFPPTSAAASAFQECETMLLGLPASGRGQGKGRRGRGRGRGGWTIANRHSSPGRVDTAGEGMEHIDPTIRDLDLLAESELLLRPAGDYSILQDILGPHCISTSQPTPANSSLRSAMSPVKSSAVRLSREPTQLSVASDGGLNDSLSLDEASATGGPSDLDDIELCEDDYRLFDPQRSASSDNQDPATAPNPSRVVVNPTVMRPWGGLTTHSGSDGTLTQYDAHSSEKDPNQHGNSDIASPSTDVNRYDADSIEAPGGEHQNSDVIGNTSLSADDYDDETRSATSEPAACTSFDTETDQDASIPHDDDDMDVDAADTEQNSY